MIHPQVVKVKRFGEILSSDPLLTPSTLPCRLRYMSNAPTTVEVLPTTRRVVEVGVTGRRIATFSTCFWLVRVPSNNPEPDFPSDCWREVECGAKITSLDGTLDHTVCDNGHVRHTIEYDLAPGGPEWMREQEGRRYGSQDHFDGWADCVS